MVWWLSIVLINEWVAVLTLGISFIWIKLKCHIDFLNGMIKLKIDFLMQFSKTVEKRAENLNALQIKSTQLYLAKNWPYN